MGSIQILLGKTRVRRRRGIARGELSGVDRNGRPNFLYITDTRRKASTVEAEFLQYRDGAAFIPDVTTLSALLEDLAIRHGDGRACWSTGGVALIAERMLTEAPEGFPWLAALGEPESVGRALADLVAKWDEADRPVLDARPELPRFLTALTIRLEADRARRPVGAALRQLAESVEAPGVALAQWLTSPHAVVIDDVLHPSPLRRRVLVALARAWSTLGTHVVFSFESGRDLGGAEAARFFDYGDDDSVAFPLRPFQATRAFRRHLFAALVAEGGEADLWIAGSEGPPREVGPGDDVGPAEPADLADRLHADVDAAPLADDELDPASVPRLVRWPDPAGEVRGIAHAVKERLLAGVPAEDICVAFPGLPGYLPLVRRIFGELGIPVQLSAGGAVRARPAAEIVLVAAASAGEGFPLAPLLAAMASSLVDALSERSALALARLCRERGITRGHPSSWRARLAVTDLDRHDEALTALTVVCDQLGPLAAPLPPAEWRDRLAGVVDAWGLVARAGRADDPGARIASQVALGRVLQALADAAVDAAAVDAGPWDPLRLARLLEERIEAASMPDLDTGPRRVQVVGMLELRGIHPPWLWVGGLIADDFPARPAEDFLLSRTARAVLDRLDPGDEARYLFASTIRNAMAEGHTLTLSWPAARDDRPIAVSPLVEDLLEVQVAGVALRKGVEAGQLPALPAGPRELDALLGEALAAGAAADPWRPYLAGADRLDRLAAIVRARRDETSFGAWDGYFGAEPDAPLPPTPPKLGVTRFEEYLACPARYFHGQLLRLAEEDSFDPDLDRSAQGRLLHGILDAFLKGVNEGGRTHLRGLSAGERVSVAQGLHRVAAAQMDADTDVQGLVAPLGAWHRTRWLAGLVDDAPKGLLAAWLDAEVDSALPASLDRTEWEFPPLQLGAVALQGRIDRVDRLEDGGALVIDYKTGRAPNADDVSAGLKVQGFVYLEAIRAHAGAPSPSGAAVYQELRGASTLQHAGWVGDPETLRALGAPERGSVPLGEAERHTLRDHLVAAGERLGRGVFHTSLAGAKRAGCGWCAYSRACRVDHERNAAIAAHHDSKWQAPLTTTEEDEEESS